VRTAFGDAGHHRQNRLFAVQGLDLAHMRICGSRVLDQGFMIYLRALFASKV